MLKNYLKIAFRNLLRNKVYLFINIGGLAVGMAVAMLIAPSFCAKSQTIQLPFTQSDNKWDFQSFNNKLGKSEPSMDYPISETYLGKESVFLKRFTFLSTKDIDFKDGTIEVDMNFPDIRNFPGIGFRFQDTNNFENFYIGPTKSGKTDATRYTPVFNGQQSWQVYAGKGYSSKFTFKYNYWHHVKIELEGLKASFYIDDMQKPLFVVNELKHDWKSGKIALIADENDLHFANFQITPKTFMPPPKPTPVTVDNGKIIDWWVSKSVSPKLFEKQYELNQAIKDSVKWEKVKIDTSGVLNFYKYSPITREKNVIIAKVTLNSVKDQLLPLKFGFSDFVTVYLNNKAIYTGEDVYGSRDDQFIGTMGYFDKVFLPLKKGDNEVWFAVTEYFGGWAVQAKFDNMEGISVK
jgi:hypothetical protein